MRITLFILAVLSATMLPLWCTFALLSGLCLRYRAWEAPFVGLYADLLWLPQSHGSWQLPLMTIVAVFLLWICEPIREWLSL